MSEPNHQDSWKKIVVDFFFCLIILPACAGFVGTIVLHVLESSGNLSDYMKVHGEQILIGLSYVICTGLFIYRFLVKPLTRQ